MSGLIRMPRLGANDEAARLVHWARADGEFVHANEVVCEVETTKAVVEIEAETAGYLRRLAELDTMVAIGCTIAAVTDTADEDCAALLRDSMPHAKMQSPKEEELCGEADRSVQVTGSVREPASAATGNCMPRTRTEGHEAGGIAGEGADAGSVAAPTGYSGSSAASHGQARPVVNGSSEQPVDFCANGGGKARPGDQPSGRRWTMKADIVAGRLGLDIAQIADRYPEKVVGEADVLAFREAPIQSPRPVAHDGVERVLILGGAGGGGAALILESLAHCPGQRAVGVLDRDPGLHGQSILGVPVIGPTEQAEALWESSTFDTAIIAFNRDLAERAALFARLSARGVRFANVIDPTARIGLGATIGVGNVVLPFCRIGPFATVGDDNFLSAYVSIEHHCRLGSHCAFGPSVAFSGFVNIGDRVRFGTGITAEPRLTVGSDAVIASGVTLIRDVPADAVVKARGSA